MSETGRKRAKAMSPEQRRSAIVEATVPLLLEHGSLPSTSTIAEAAGVAEGTLFRVFSDKQELLGACMATVLDPSDSVTALRAIPAELPVAERLRRASIVLAEQWERVVRVGHVLRSTMHHSATPAPHGPRRHGPGETMQALAAAVTELITPDAARLRLSPKRTAQLFLVAVSGDRMRRLGLGATDESTEDITQVIDVFLYGALRADHTEPDRGQPT